MNRISFKHILFMIFVSIMPLFIFGCSSGESKNDKPNEENIADVSNSNYNFAGSCDIREGVGFCYDFRGSGWSSDDAKYECGGAPGGVYSDKPCPEADAVGKCSYFPGSRDKEIFYVFYKPTMDEGTAKLSCPGKFIPAQ